MMHQRLQKPSSWNSTRQPNQDLDASCYSTLPLQPARHHASTPEDLESEAFDQNKFEALGLQIKQAYTPTTPIAQERLSVLQAKRDDFWAQKLERVAQPIQATLSLGQPNDKYEQEADRLASQVVAQIHTPTIEGQTLQRQRNPDEKIQAKLAPDPIERGPDMDLASAINCARADGKSLDLTLQQSMGQIMKADFSGVRIHTDAQADLLNQSIQAQAFTTGQDIFFRQGSYDPVSRAGQELIAHELTHVMQQNRGLVQPQESSELQPDIGNPSPPQDHLVQRKLIIAGSLITSEQINDNGAFKTRLNQSISQAARAAGIEPYQVRSKLTDWSLDTGDHEFASKLDAAYSAADEVQEKYIPNISSKDYDIIRILDSGSTKPQHVKFKASQQEKVIKFGSDKGHLQTEILANNLYQAANIPTLKIDIVRVDGQLAQMTDFVKEFKTPDETDLMTSQDFLRHVGADMLFANWDLFKTDNWMQIDGRMIRADNGGALDRSAQGRMKAEADWNGKTVKDFASMRSKTNSPYRNITDHEIADSIRTLARNLTPEKIDQAFNAARYPVQLRKTMRATLLDRLNIALSWANQVYALDKVVKVDHSWDKAKKPSSDYQDDAPIDLALELAEWGFKNVPLGASPEILGELLRMGIIEPPDPQGKTGNPHESIPMVGPEELTRKDQFGQGLALKMPKFFDRMKTGRLLRRMSDGERQAFEQAAAAKDINTIVDLIFPATGKGARGEMVWSVNKPFVFEREMALLKGETYTGTEEAHDPKDYHWIMEIYITDEMLQFLQDYAYINNPTGGAKPSAFLGNPTLKQEGAAGGVRDKEGIPNVVLKKDGFAKFWRTVQSFHFVKAEEHLWRHASNNEELIKAKIEQARAQKKIQVQEERRKKKEKQQADDPFDLSWF